MRVLVTGGGGFLGAAVSRALSARGDTVIAFDTHLSRLTTTGDANLVCVSGDITDLSHLAQAVHVHRPDTVIHCAAIVGVLSSLGSPINVVRVNVEGSLNVFEAMRLGSVRRCIHISSEDASRRLQYRQRPGGHHRRDDREDSRSRPRGAALGRPGPYRHGDRVEMIRKGALDVSRAATELGWVPHYDMRSGLAEYVRELRNSAR